MNKNISLIFTFLLTASFIIQGAEIRKLMPLDCTDADHNLYIEKQKIRSPLRMDYSTEQLHVPCNNSLFIQLPTCANKTVSSALIRSIKNNHSNDAFLIKKEPIELTRFFSQLHKEHFAHCVDLYIIKHMLLDYKEIYKNIKKECYCEKKEFCNSANKWFNHRLNISPTVSHVIIFLVCYKKSKNGINAPSTGTKVVACEQLVLPTGTPTAIKNDKTACIDRQEVIQLLATFSILLSLLKNESSQTN